MTQKTYSRSAYEKLGMDAPYTGPFSLENRGAYDQGGGGNYYASRGKWEKNLLGCVIHITAGITGVPGSDRSAENTDNWGRTTTTQASWPCIVDSDSIINSLHPKRVAWLHGVRGYNFNTPLWGLEVGKRDTDWDKMAQSWVDATLQNIAAAVAPLAIEHNWPLRLMTNRNEIANLISQGKKVGFTEHYVLDPSNRSDAGLHGGRSTFPWTRFFMFLRSRMNELKAGSAPGQTNPPTTPKTIVKGTVLRTTASAGLNTRTGPGTNHDVVGTVPNGTEILATGKVSGPWIEAASPYQRKHDQTSWWHSGYTKIVSQPKPKPKPKPPAPKTPTLRRGMRSNAVKKLQADLIRVFPAYAGPIIQGGGPINIYGPGTEKVIREFQRRSGISVVGWVGPATWRELRKHGITPG